MKILISVALFGFAGLIREGDAITGWTVPAINTADGAGTLSVDENQALDTAIVTYIAISDNTPITYTLVTAVAPFDLTTGGVLTITSTALDFETNPTYELKIKAVDSTTGTALSGTVTIAVTVNDVNEVGVNEVGPVFATTYSPCIVDGSTHDTTLTTVAATDADTDETITYTIEAGNTGTVFTIDGTSGVIKVASGKTLDKTTLASYDLQVKAADNGSPVKTATTTVSVTVADSCQPENGVVAVALSMTTLLFAFFVSIL